MSKKLLIGLIALAGIIVFAVITMATAWGYQNDEVRYVNEFESQKSKIEAVHDNMWKTIQQKAGVSKEYAAQFDSIYTHITSARYDKNDGVLMNWIQESNPQFTADLYKDLSVAIEVERQKFLNAQTKIIDIVREHNNMLDVIPSKWFLGGRKKLEWEVISSTTTKSVMDSKVDDNVDLFN